MLPNKAMEKLTKAQVCAILDYEPETGIFRWKERRTRNHYIQAGKIAGFNTTWGYYGLRINERQYMAHRVAWLVMTGEWPPVGFEIDHIDLNKRNNAWTNLRLATTSQNHANTKTYSRSGFKGVRRRGSKYTAEIVFHRKSIYLGTFLTPEEAHAAYMKVARKLHGEFARAS